MEFLLAALKKTRRRLQLENLLLLLIRTMIVILLAFSLSRCYIKENPFIAGAVDTHAIIVLDDSYSMDYKVGLKTYFEQGKEIAIQLVDSLKTSRGDQVSLLTASANPFAPAGGLISEGSSDFEKVKKTIANLSVSDFGTDLLKTFQESLEVADKSDRTRKVFYLITNAQRTDWPIADKQQAGFTELINNLGKKVELQIIDVSKPQAGNYLITRIEPSRQIITTDSPVTFQAEIRNFNPQPAYQIQVDFIVDNFMQDSAAIDLPANGIATTSFNYEFKEPGPHWITIRLASDNLAIDNKRSYAMDVKDTLKILLVNGEGGTESFDDETIFLQYALNPSRSETERASIYALEIASDLVFEDTDVKKYDLVVLANLPFLSQVKVKSLEKYVSAGGGLLIFLGDKIDRTIYNELLYRNGNGLLPGELGGILGDRNHEKAVYLEEIDFTHNALEYLKPLKAQFGKMVIYEFYDIKIDAARQDTRVIARFNSVSDRSVSDGPASAGENTPALSEKLFGRGKVMLVTTSADAEWNLMPGRKLYVMLFDQIVMYLASQPSEFKNLLVGQTLRLLLKTSDYAPNFSLATPQQGLTTISPFPFQDKTADSEPGRFMLAYNRTERHGIYTLNRLTESQTEEGAHAPLEAPPEQIALFSYWAVNLDPAEGNLQRITEEELKQLYPGFQFRKTEELSQTPETSITKPPPSSIWKFLVYTVLILLVLESILAQRFGTFSASPRRGK